MARIRSIRKALVWVVGMFLLLPWRAYAYSVQTHEQLVDLAWKPAIVPLLLERYPGLTEAQLREAHAYAYGGCAIQDVGYYPFGSEFFSNLTHYVRSGDFVRSLLRNAGTPDELAFAVGALTHYVGDSTGHSIAVNPSVAVDFPKLKARFGDSVTYDENPHAHVRVEFGFDIDELSKRRFAPSRYLEHVGLKVSTDLLARAFHETYGLELYEVIGKTREKSSIKGYSFAVRHFLPRIAYAETVLHGRKMPADADDAEFHTLEAALKQSEFENGWDAYRKKAGLGTYCLAGIIYILPPVGPFALTKIKVPSEETEQEYVRSVNASTARVRVLLGDLESKDAGQLAVDIPNRDLDTGLRVTPGSYRLTDQTYAQLLGRIAQPGYGKLPSGLKRDMLAYYADASAPIATKKNAKKWARVQADLVALQRIPTLPEP
jgi:hypothetical protein